MQKATPKRKAVFLDRDGTVVRFVPVLHTVSNLRLLSGSAKAISELKRMGFLTVLVTNQPIVARGLATEKEVDNIHAALQARLKKSGAELDAIYVCPHHPEATIPAYRIACDCRKPEIGMITKAAEELGIDLVRSFIIGDTTRDTLAGNRAKLTTILVKTGEGGKDKYQFPGKPDHIARDLHDAVRYIKTHPRS